MANEKKYERSIELLNNALAEENTASLQYMYFHTHFEDDRYQYTVRWRSILRGRPFRR